MDDLKAKPRPAICAMRGETGLVGHEGMEKHIELLLRIYIEGGGFRLVGA